MHMLKMIVIKLVNHRKQCSWRKGLVLKFRSQKRMMNLMRRHHQPSERRENPGTSPSNLYLT